jgi:hypothetical protein
VVLALWVGIRGALAAQQLNQATPIATSLKKNLLAGDKVTAESEARDLSARTSAAASLTGDPGWAAAELIPFVGPNLQALRLAATSAAVVSTQVVTPLVGLTDAADLKRLAPHDGTIDYSFLEKSAAATAEANGAAVQAQALLAQIDPRFLIAPLGDAVVTLTSAVDSAASAVHAINALTHITPKVLGAGGSTNTLVVVQNPAELRATGGLMGAMALINADKGVLSLVRQATAGDLNHNIVPPVDVVNEDTAAVFGLQPARLISDANVTPDFAQSAEIVSTVWHEKFGDNISSVISLDPVALSYILGATGPVELPGGQVISQENAVSYLLTDVYFQLDPTEQDAVFAAVAAVVFDHIASGQVDATALLAAVARSGDEHRIFVWNADPKDQKFIAGTTLADLLPSSAKGNAGFGLYLNDATASKMDPYLTTSVVWGLQDHCRQDGRTTAIFDVTLTNTAPANAGEVFPPSVTGAGGHGTPAGNIRTSVMMYGIPDGVWGQALLDGVETPVFTVTTAHYATATRLVELAPGQGTQLTFRMLMPDGVDAHTMSTRLISTPALHFEAEENAEKFDCKIGLR